MSLALQGRGVISLALHGGGVMSDALHGGVMLLAGGVTVLWLQVDGREEPAGAGYGTVLASEDEGIEGTRITGLPRPGAAADEEDEEEESGGGGP